MHSLNTLIVSQSNLPAIGIIQVVTILAVLTQAELASAMPDFGKKLKNLKDKWNSITENKPDEDNKSQENAESEDDKSNIESTIISRLSSKQQSLYRMFSRDPKEFDHEVSSAKQKKWDSQEPGKLGMEAFNRMQSRNNLNWNAIDAWEKENPGKVSPARERYDENKKESDKFDAWAIKTGKYESETNWLIKSWWDDLLKRSISDTSYKVQTTNELIDTLKNMATFEKNPKLAKKLELETERVQKIQQIQDAELVRLQTMQKKK